MSKNGESISDMPEPIIRLNPVAAEARGIADGDMVQLVTAHGSIEAKACLSNIVREDTIDMIHGWEQANVNLVYARDFDPLSGFPSYKEGLCDVRKL